MLASVVNLQGRTSKGRPAASGWRALAPCLLVILAFASVGYGAPAAMAAEGQAFSELTQGGQTTPTTTTATTSTEASTSTTSNSKSLILVALGAAIALLIGIAYFIVRDARRVAPAGDAVFNEGGPSSRDPAAQLRRRRARAKAARQQRKRNLRKR
jgi:hypothetical protein